MKIFASICFLILTTAVLLPAQNASNTSSDEARIMALETAWNQAEEHNDARAVAELLASTLAYTDYDGTFMDKTQFLASVKNSTEQNHQIVNEGVTVSIYGDAAIVTGAYRDKGTEKGKPFMRHGRFTDTWVKQNGTWLCVASTSTLIGH
ncbi:MAG: nuclear transport factor 2 family protein [Candidatus Acidiferrales bacterium]